MNSDSRDGAHDRLDVILNEKDRNRPGFSVDWRHTRIRGSQYAHANDVWQRLELGDAPPRFAVDDVLEGSFEEPETLERRDVVARNRSFGTASGRIVAFDSLDGQPVGVLADFVEKHLRGRELDRCQAGYAVGLRYYLSDKSSMAEVNPVTVRALLRGLVA